MKNSIEPSYNGEEGRMPKDSNHLRHILLVDDNEILRNSIEECLNEIGYLVITAKNGREAIEIVDQMGDQISLLITDLCMPVLDGIALIQYVRKFDSKLPIVVITGFDKDEVLGQTDNLNVISIYKPLDFNVLESQICHLWPKH